MNPIINKLEQAITDCYEITNDLAKQETNVFNYSELRMLASRLEEMTSLVLELGYTP